MTVKYYGVFDVNGNPQSFWADDIYPPQPNGDPNTAIPPNAVEITHGDWLTLVSNPGATYLNGTVNLPPASPAPTPPTPTLVLSSDQYLTTTQAASPTGQGHVVFSNAAAPEQATALVIDRIDGNQSDWTSLLTVAAQAGRIIRVEERLVSANFASYTIEDLVTTAADTLTVNVTPLNDESFVLADDMKVSISIFIDNTAAVVGGAGAVAATAAHAVIAKRSPTAVRAPKPKATARAAPPKPKRR